MVTNRTTGLMSTLIPQRLLTPSPIREGCRLVGDKIEDVERICRAKMGQPDDALGKA